MIFIAFLGSSCPAGLHGLKRCIYDFYCVFSLLSLRLRCRVLSWPQGWPDLGPLYEEGGKPAPCLLIRSTMAAVA